MKRSEINKALHDLEAMCEKYHCYESPVTVHCDGLVHTVLAGTQIRLCPAESIWITQEMYHGFVVEKGTGAVLPDGD